MGTRFYLENIDKENALNKLVQIIDCVEELQKMINEDRYSFEMLGLTTVTEEALRIVQNLLLSEHKKATQGIIEKKLNMV